jgi:tetratricopeptide (TPR) repeat protein
LNFQLAKGWCLLGQTQYYLGDYDEAQASLRKAIDLDPDGEGGKMARESLATLEQTLKERESRSPDASSGPPPG